MSSVRRWTHVAPSRKWYCCCNLRRCTADFPFWSHPTCCVASLRAGPVGCISFKNDNKKSVYSGGIGFICCFRHSWSLDNFAETELFVWPVRDRHSSGLNPTWWEDHSSSRSTRQSRMLSVAISGFHMAQSSGRWFSLFSYPQLPISYHPSMCNSTNMPMILNYTLAYLLVEYKATKDLINDCTSSLQDWFLQNGLCLNPEKSEALLIGTGACFRTHFSEPEITVSIANCPIKVKSEIKNLGVVLDRTLSLDRHVEAVCKSAHCHIRALQYIRGSLSTDQAKSVSCAIIGSRLDYCNGLLVGTSVKNITRLQQVQNSAVRVVKRCENSNTSGRPWENSMAPDQSSHHFQGRNDNFQSSGFIRTDLLEWTFTQIPTDQIPAFLRSKSVVGAAMQNCHCLKGVFCCRAIYMEQSAKWHQKLWQHCIVQEEL